ncbi:MAG: ABC transporter permease [Clostridia bacterium]|nr:ABC transporter permease [Clostridia bacterium]
MAVEYLGSLWQTVYITVLGTGISYLVGIPLGVILYGTSKGSIFPNKALNSVLGFIVNIFRSVPFIILLILTMPVAKLIVGTKMGNAAFIVYLSIAAIPFVARMVESSLHEVNLGIIEAAQSIGTGNLKLITKVLIPEAKPSLLTGAAIAFTTILGYTPMTYLIAGGGLGNLAIRYGIYRFDSTIMYISSIMLIIVVQVFQESFMLIARKTDRRLK